MPNGTPLNLVGQVFGKLEVIRLVSRGSRSNRPIWECQCKCGGTHTTQAKFLTTGRVRSCGCLYKEAAAARGREQLLPAETWLGRILEKIAHQTYGECGWCGSLFVKAEHTKQQAYCSRQCKKNAWDPTFGDSFECVICDGLFVPKVHNQRTCGFYCSRLLKKRRPLPKGSSSIRIKTEVVKPLAVFERDQWICQVCGEVAPKELRGTYDKCAPELGHIIPHALGGSYTLDNLQCEHRKCNLQKNQAL